jgi:hypothetical protein
MIISRNRKVYRFTNLTSYAQYYVINIRYDSLNVIQKNGKVVLNFNSCSIFADYTSFFINPNIFNVSLSMKDSYVSKMRSLYYFITTYVCSPLFLKTYSSYGLKSPCSLECSYWKLWYASQSKYSRVWISIFFLWESYFDSNSIRIYIF